MPLQRWYHWGAAGVRTWNLLRWPVSRGLIVVTMSVLFRYAPRRHQPGLSWLMFGAGLATALWWLVSLLLAAYVTKSRDFGATYGPLTAGSRIEQARGQSASTSEAALLSKRMG